MRRMLSRILDSKTTTRRRARPKTSLRVEALEQRDLMSVTAATLNNGFLHVTCDAANDQVEIRETSSGPIINFANPSGVVRASTGTITVKDLTHTADNTFTFERSDVQLIAVDLGGGGGRLVSDASVPTSVGVGDGNTYVETGPDSDTIQGGAGNDTILGGAGNDVISGGEGNNVLYGQSGNDKLFGGSGHNFLLGGADDDALHSVSRNDVVDGEDGRDTFFIMAGSASVHHGEEVLIAVDHDQPQTDGFSCGPNSGSRFLRSYGIDASYDALRHKVKAESLLFRFHLGTRPSVLNKVLKKFKSDLTLQTKSSLQNVLDLLGAGKPVIALVATRSKTLSIGGKYGILHYVVLNGFGLDSQTIRYVDTDGVQKLWTFAEFDFHWKWIDHFTGVVGNSMQAGLHVLGIQKRTILF